jgi:geranylgeranyl pyrophosphate synthase
MAEPSFMRAYRVLIDQALDQALLQLTQERTRLADAIRYSVLQGGKRVRPTLAMLTANSLGSPPEQTVHSAISLELVHAYSLIHDDLPAMDDDDLRRGQPTCHRAFDEATAILAGDALQAMAFELIADAPFPDSSRRLQITGLLARASGARGMVLGQAVDLESEGRLVDLPHLQAMHGWKTGALIRASIELGALCAPAPLAPEKLRALSRFGDQLGLAFQIQDDILDVISDTVTLGKKQGADQALHKSTYPSLLGLDGARQTLLQVTREAEQALTDLAPGQALPLREMLHYIVQRNY